MFPFITFLHYSLSIVDQELMMFISCRAVIESVPLNGVSVP